MQPKYLDVLKEVIQGPHGDPGVKILAEMGDLVPVPGGELDPTCCVKQLTSFLARRPLRKDPHVLQLRS